MATPHQNPADSLTPLQHQAIALMASGRRISTAAKEIGVHRSTLHNWFELPAFRNAYDEASRLASAAVSDQMHELSRLALDTLRQILTDEKASPSVKLKASLAILNHEAANRNGLWALPYPIAAPRPKSASPLPAPADFSAMNRTLFSDPAFLARYAPQMLKRETEDFNPTQFDPSFSGARRGSPASRR